MENNEKVTDHIYPICSTQLYKINRRGCDQGLTLLPLWRNGYWTRDFTLWLNRSHSLSQGAYFSKLPDWAWIAIQSCLLLICKFQVCTTPLVLYTVKSSSNAGSSPISQVQLVIRLLVICLSPIKIQLLHLNTNISKSITFVKRSHIYLITAANMGERSKIILRACMKNQGTGERPRLTTQTFWYCMPYTIQSYHSRMFLWYANNSHILHARQSGFCTSGIMLYFRRVNVAEIVANANEPSIQESKDFIDALTCRKCRRNIVSIIDNISVLNKLHISHFGCSQHLRNKVVVWM